MISLQQLQDEVHEWRLKNFPDSGVHTQYIGMVEELGELEDASFPKDVRDAIGDFFVYTASFCSFKGWSLAAIWDSGERLPRSGELSSGQVLSLIAKVGHHHLKFSQGIRMSEDHDAQGQVQLCKLLTTLRRGFGVEMIMSCIAETWSKVRQRDWTKNKETGMP